MWDWERETGGIRRAGMGMGGWRGSEGGGGTGTFIPYIPICKEGCSHDNSL